MAEVKTFKCDICGEVYYSDDVKTTAIITVTEPSEEEDEAPEVNTYRHICPKCTRNIKHYVNEPDIVEKNHKEHRTKNKLEGCLSRLYHLGISYRTFWYGSHDPKYYDDVTETIEKEYKRMEKSLERCKKISIFSICFAIGILIGEILQLFI